MESGGRVAGEGGDRTSTSVGLLFRVCLSSDVPVLLQGLCVVCGSLTPQRISSLKSGRSRYPMWAAPRGPAARQSFPRPPSSHHPRLSCYSTPPLQPGPLRRKGVMGGLRVLGLPARPHGVSKLRSEAQLLSEQVSPCVVCSLAICIRRDAELSF
ncbi:hypothetical protein NDU88_004547 [Pleurodeles waltl]|uniref:Uncharacterized protein n=1 Tax=Pleurodeles waltl TaxID=8319 RepID=A0AAV7V3R7_PLEWA|nr:hypothetical protein NDU88_004547 [Pleurodeles waltl]